MVWRVEATRQSAKIREDVDFAARGLYWRKPPLELSELGFDNVCQ